MKITLVTQKEKKTERSIKSKDRHKNDAKAPTEGSVFIIII